MKEESQEQENIEDERKPAGPPTLIAPTYVRAVHVLLPAISFARNLMNIFVVTLSNLDALLRPPEERSSLR